MLAEYRTRAMLAAAASSAHDCLLANASPPTPPDTEAEMLQDAMAVAMAHIDSMKFRYYESDAEVQRAKSLAHDVIEAIKPALVRTLEPHMKAGVDLGQLIEPILSVLDPIHSTKLEATERQKNTAKKFPPLKASPSAHSIPILIPILFPFPIPIPIPPPPFRPPRAVTVTSRKTREIKGDRAKT